MLWYFTNSLSHGDCCSYIRTEIPRLYTFLTNLHVSAVRWVSSNSCQQDRKHCRLWETSTHTFQVVNGSELLHLPGISKDKAWKEKKTSFLDGLEEGRCSKHNMYSPHLLQLSCLRTWELEPHMQIFTWLLPLCLYFSLLAQVWDTALQKPCSFCSLRKGFRKIKSLLVKLTPSAINNWNINM